YDTRSGREELTLDVAAVRRAPLFSLSDGSAHGISPAPDNKHAVISAGWSDVRTWDLVTGKAVFNLSPGFVYMGRKSCRFSADGATAVIETESTVRLFDAATGYERSV